jgi:hypothetical protein
MACLLFAKFEGGELRDSARAGFSRSLVAPPSAAPDALH